MTTSSLEITRKFTPGELFARARAAEAATGIGQRRIFCSLRTWWRQNEMPRTSVTAGSGVAS